MKLTQFNPPGFLADFTPENAKRWSDEFVSPRMTREEQLPQVSQFYNEVTSDFPPEIPQRHNITWVAFPNTVRHNHPANLDRWREAEREFVGAPRRNQDEYCEWSVLRDPENKVLKITFTAEGPEYWQRLARWQPETVLELYRKHNPGFDIKKEDLFSGPDGKYNPHNKWNNRMDTGSIMHLVQHNNSLRAQFHLGGQSTVRRMDRNNRPIRDSDRLLRCSRLGGPYRNSDPHIGISINDLAHRNPLITIADPVGLYLDAFDGSSFKAPDDADVNDFWKWTRGETGKGHDHWVRAVFEVPKEKPYVVGDIEDENGNRIQWGGQLADHILVRITGQAIREGQHTAEMHYCIGSDLSTTVSMAAGDNEEEEGGDRAEDVEDTEFCCY